MVLNLTTIIEKPLKDTSFLSAAVLRTTHYTLWTDIAWKAPIDNTARYHDTIYGYRKAYYYYYCSLAS